MRSARCLIVFAAVALYVAATSWFAIASHRALLTQLNDLGNVDQALWSASRGDWSMTQSNDVDGRIKPRLAVHLNLLFYPLALLYLLAPNPELLLPLASLGIGAAALGLFAYARLRHGDSWWTIAAPLAFLANPMVHDANVYDFKIVTLVTAALVWSIWAFDSGRTRLGIALAALILLAQEDLALLVISLGLYLVLTKRRRLGVALIVAAVLYLVIMLTIIVPAINEGAGLAKIAGEGSRVAWMREAGVGAYLEKLVRPDRLRLPFYLLMLGAAAAFPAWRVLVVALPIVIGSMLAATPWMTQITGTYYHAPSTAIVILAVIQSGRARLAWPLVASLLASFLFSPLPHSIVASFDNYADRTHERAALQRIAGCIPAEAAVTVQNNLGPWIAHRRDVAAFPRRIRTAQYALFHMRCVTGPNSGLFPRTSARVLFQLTPETLARNIEAFLQSPEWTLVAYEDGFYLFRRGEGVDAANDFARDRARLIEECRAADAHRRPWARWLVGRYP